MRPTGSRRGTRREPAPALPHQYAALIERTPSLSAAEEQLLLARITDGRNAAVTLSTIAVTTSLRVKLEARVKDGQTARERLVLAHLRLVPDVARAHVGRLPYADLVQEGSLGLVRAVESYVPARGGFTAYARRWVRRSIARAIAAASEAGRDYAAPAEAPEAPEVPDAERLRHARGRVRQALTHLDALETKVLELRFGLVDGTARSVEEIGRRLGVTRERVRQILEGALDRLRHAAAPAAA